MSEMFDAVDANRAAADDRERAEAEAAEAALAEWRAQEVRRRIRRRKRATRGFILRAALALFFGILVVAAQNAGLIDPRLAGPAVAFLVSWLSVWFGAWLQFMFADGGLLNVFK